MNDWKVALATKMKLDHTRGTFEPILQIYSKKRGRPSLVAEDIAAELKCYVHDLRDAGGRGCEHSTL